MSSESSGVSSLLRWRPALLGLTAVAAGLGIYYVSYSDRQWDSDSGNTGLRRSNAVRRRSPRLRHARASIAGDRSTGTQPVGAEMGAEVSGTNDTDDDSEFDPSKSIAGETEGVQSLLNLLYHIAEEQAHREGYVHRGVTCNSCNNMPIKGIRYRCANCPDYDLCEQCENLGVHDKTHLFYKIRIPAPFLGANPRNQQPVWYPGKAYGLPRTIPKELRGKLMELTGFDRSRIDALWEQFKSLAAVDWPEDPNGLRIAIDRNIWAKYCMPTMLREHEAASALIFDQMFTFFDDNEDGLVGFEEFLVGLATQQGKDQHEKCRRIFRAHDLDRDGYVCRDDFMRLFTSNYTFMRELSREPYNIMYEEILDDRSLRENLRGTQPVSSCFTATIPPGVDSRIGEGKTMSSTGDWVVTDGGDLMREADDGFIDDHSSSVNRRSEGVISSLFNELGQSCGNWPPSFVTAEDAFVALGKSVSLDSITGVTEQRLVLDAAHQRLERSGRNSFRQPQNGEPGGQATGATSDTSSPTSVAESGPSTSSRQDTPETSSDQDDATKNDYSDLALTGSFAQEFLYQATREGFDEILDPMFKQLEDLHDYYERSLSERIRLMEHISLYRSSSENEMLAKRWLSRTLRQWRKGEIESSVWVSEKLIEEVIRKLVKETELGSNEWVVTLLDRIYQGFITEEQLNSTLENLSLTQGGASQNLILQIRHEWIKARQEKTPSEDQLDEMLDSLDEHVLGEANGEAHPDPESEPDTATPGVIVVDEQFIQNILDGENEEEENTSAALAPLSEGDIDFILQGINLQGNRLASSTSQLPLQDEATSASQNLSLTDDGHHQNALSIDEVDRALDTFNFGAFPDEMDIDSVFDPTLPHHRPDSVDEPGFTLFHTNSDRTTEHAAREKAKKFVQWTQANTPGSIASMEQKDPIEDQQGDYFQVKLKYLTILEMVGEEAEKRGGVARLDRYEFEQIIMGIKGRNLGTIGKWLDLAAF